MIKNLFLVHLSEPIKRKREAIRCISIIMDEQNCKCGKPAVGWKCSDKDCGMKTDSHDPDHKHGEANTCERCCSGCEESESNCSCVPATM